MRLDLPWGSGYAARKKRLYRRMQRMQAVRRGPILGDGSSRLAYFPGNFGNPYIHLLYAHMSGRPIPLHTVEDGLRLFDLGWIGVLHLHFEGQYLKRAASPGGQSGDEALGRMVTGLERFCGSGGRLVWTVHDLDDHFRAETPPALRDARQRLAGLADMVHVHSRSAKDAAQQAFGIPSEKFAIVEHPSYANAYGHPDRPAQPGRKKRLLSFGEIRPFKGIHGFLHALGQADVDESFGHYLIAGLMHPQTGPLDPAIPDNRNVTLDLNRVPDDRVRELFQNADFLVLAYERSLTSGAAALAMTMGVPVIASNIGNMREAVPAGNHPLFYDPAEPGALRRAIERACKMPPEEHIALQRACLAYAAERSPARIAGQLVDEMKSRGILRA